MVIPGYYNPDYYAALCLKYGTTNITLWSNKGNNSTNPDYNSIQLAVTTGEAQFNNFWQNGPYVVPLNPVNGQIADWAVSVVAWWLYTKRGLFESGDPVGAKLKTEYNAAISMMANYKGNTSVMAFYPPLARRWPSPTAAVASWRR
jgi:Protein of unknown function (DUF1320)